MFYLDAHVDSLLNYYQDKEYNFFKTNKNFQLDLPRLKKANIKIQVLAICVEPYFKNKLLDKAIEIIHYFYSLIDKSKKLLLIKTKDDIDTVLKNKNQIGFILALEGIPYIFNIDTLNTFYNLGVRMVSLTWNYQNHLATGIADKSKDQGLSLKGKKLISKMEQLGMIIDVSHLAPLSFQDVLNYAEKTVIASHCNSYTICPHPRNLNDSQIIALAKQNGVIGINFYPNFLNQNNKADISDVIKHIEYINNLVGLKYLGLGTDYDGIETTPEKLEDISKLPLLAKALSKYGYNQREIEYILKDNWLSLFKKLL